MSHNAVEPDFNNFLSVVMGRWSAGSPAREQAHWRGAAVIMILAGLAEARTGDAWKNSTSPQVQLLRYMRNAIAHGGCDMAQLDRNQAKAMQLLADDFRHCGGHDGFYVLDNQVPTKFWLLPKAAWSPTPEQHLKHETTLMRSATWAYAVLHPFFT